MVENALVICQALGSTPNINKIEKFCLIFKEKVLLFSVKALSSCTQVTYVLVALFFSFLLIYQKNFDCYVPDMMVSAKNPVMNKRVPGP